MENLVKLKKDKDVLKDIQDSKNFEQYIPNQDEKELVERINERFSDMQQARSEFENEWENNFIEYRSKITARKDNLSNLDIPLEFQVIETKLAEEYDNPPRYNFIAIEESDQKKIPIIDKVWEYAWWFSNSDREMLKTQFSRLLHGTAIWFEGWKTKRRMIWERIGKQKMSDEQWNYKEKEIIEYDDVIGELVDVRDFFIDENATSMEDARDCVRRYYFSDVESFRLSYNGSVYKNVDKVQALNVSKEKNNPEESQKGNVVFEVEVWEYWNRVEDRLIVVANKNTIIRNTPIPYDHKELPFVRFIDHYMEGQFYGLGEVQRLKADKDIKNRISNMIIDNASVVMFPPILTDFDSEFDGDEYEFGPGKVWRVGGTAQVMNIPDLSSAGYNLTKFLDEDIIATTGIDTKALIRQASETATKTAVRQESQNKRINLGLKFNEFDGFKRLGRLRLKNIQQFYPIPVIKRIVEKDGMGNPREKTKAVNRRIPVEGIEVRQKEGSLRFEERQGALSSFELDPEFVRGEFDVMVVPGATKPISQELKKAKAMEAIELLSRVDQIQARKAQEGMPVLRIDLEEPIKQLAEALGWDPEKMFNEEDQGNARVMKELKRAGLLNPERMQGQGMNQQKNQMPQARGMQNIAQQQPAKQLSDQLGQAVAL